MPSRSCSRQFPALGIVTRLLLIVGIEIGTDIGIVSWVLQLFVIKKCVTTFRKSGRVEYGRAATRTLFTVADTGSPALR